MAARRSASGRTSTRRRSMKGRRSSSTTATSYLSWVWDIPISPTQTSIGFVLPAERVRDRRRAGDTSVTILRDELARHPRFHRLLDAQSVIEVESTSFQPYVTATRLRAQLADGRRSRLDAGSAHGQWRDLGMRHARHAVDAILAAGTADQIDQRRRRVYSQHVVRLGHAFNAHIENAVYRPHLRWGLACRRRPTSTRSSRSS